MSGNGSYAAIDIKCGAGEDDGKPDLKQRLLNRNEDDCVAMRVVLDAMKGFEVRV